MNKIQVRTALETMYSIKDELIEERKKVAEDLAYIEEQIEAIMTLIPVFMKRKDSVLEVKITVPPAHLENLVGKYAEDEIITTVIDVPVKTEPVPPPEPPEVITTKKQRLTGLTDEERHEREKKQKREWFARNKDKLKEKKNKKAVVPEVFGKQFEEAVQTEKPLPMHVLEKHEPKLNYFGDGE